MLSQSTLLAVALQVTTIQDNRRASSAALDGLTFAIVVRIEKDHATQAAAAAAGRAANWGGSTKSAFTLDCKVLE